MFLHSLKSTVASASVARGVAGIALGLGLCALGGCSRYSRTKQCRALIAQVNPALDDVLTITHGGETADAGVGGSGSYVAAAGRYERLAKALGPMEFATEDMAKMVAEYAGVLNSSAASLRTLAAGLDSNNITESERATANSIASWVMSANSWGGWRPGVNPEGSVTLTGTGAATPELLYRLAAFAVNAFSIAIYARARPDFDAQVLRLLRRAANIARALSLFGLLGLYLKWSNAAGALAVLRP